MKIPTTSIEKMLLTVADNNHIMKLKIPPITQNTTLINNKPTTNVTNMPIISIFQKFFITFW